MKKVIKLSKNDLRKLISESIRTREPGSPLFTPEKDLDEAFGAWDRKSDWYDSGSMMPHHFENAAKEEFSILLDQVVEQFVDSHMEMIAAGFSPESQPGFREELMEVALAMKQELMAVISKHSKKFAESV